MLNFQVEFLPLLYRMYAGEEHAFSYKPNNYRLPRGFSRASLPIDTHAPPMHTLAPPMHTHAPPMHTHAPPMPPVPPDMPAGVVLEGCVEAPGHAHEFLGRAQCMHLDGLLSSSEAAPEWNSAYIIMQRPPGAIYMGSHKMSDLCIEGEGSVTTEMNLSMRSLIDLQGGKLRLMGFFFDSGGPEEQVTFEMRHKSQGVKLPVEISPGETFFFALRATCSKTFTGTFARQIFLVIEYCSSSPDMRNGLLSQESTGLISRVVTGAIRGDYDVQLSTYTDSFVPSLLKQLLNDTSDVEQFGHWVEDADFKPVVPPERHIANMKYLCITSNQKSLSTSFVVAYDEFLKRPYAFGKLIDAYMHSVRPLKLTGKCVTIGEGRSSSFETRVSQLKRLGRRDDKAFDVLGEALDHGAAAFRELVEAWVDRQHFLLTNEHAQMKRDIMQFDKFFVQLRAERIVPHSRDNNRCAIDVSFCAPGANENRPKVMPGDFIVMRCATGSRAFTGQVRHFSLKDEIVRVQITLPIGAGLEVHVKKYPLPKKQNTDRNVVQSIMSDFATCKWHIRFQMDTTGLSVIGNCLERVIRNHADNVSLLWGEAVKFTLLPTRYPKTLTPATVEELTGSAWNAAPLFAIHLYGDASCTRLPPCTPLFPADLNAQQRKALCDIEARFEPQRTPAGFLQNLRPYVIHGPPGTGKTRTLVHAIVHMVHRLPALRVLVCAPTDAAADVLATRLLDSGIPLNSLVRLFNYKVPPSWYDTRQHLRDAAQFKNDGQQMVFDIPDMTNRDIRIVVTTCGTAGLLQRDVSDPLDKFGLVVIDEASQVMEMETLVPIQLRSAMGLVVLAGDPMQQSATPRSGIVQLATGGQSLIELCLGSDVYKKSVPADRMSVFLSMNYRSHPTLLEFPSRLFYQGKLASGADLVQASRMLKFFRVPQFKPYPLLFCGVNGRHDHELHSVSLFNSKEVVRCVELCAELLPVYVQSWDLKNSIGTNMTEEDVQDIKSVHASTIRGAALRPTEVGVICAFRQQVLMTRTALREAGLHGVNVGTVEDFQGQELRVILISTVQTAPLPRKQGSASIGFVGHPKRINVAVTRAAELTIVIGHPTFLYGADEIWRQLIELAVRRDSFSGEPCHQLLDPSHSQQHSVEGMGVVIGTGVWTGNNGSASRSSTTTVKDDDDDDDDLLLDEIIYWRPDMGWKDFQ